MNVEPILSVQFFSPHQAPPYFMLRSKDGYQEDIGLEEGLNEPSRIAVVVNTGLRNGGIVQKDLKLLADATDNDILMEL